MNRIDRISAILIHLQSRRVVRAADLAERFGTSLRTIYRDIRTLEESGVPIESEAGIGYSLMQGYRLPPVVFSREEAGSLLLSEKLMSQLSDHQAGDQHRSAMFKIRAVLQNADKEFLELMDERVWVRKTRYLPESPQAGFLGLITDALVARKCLRLRYFSNHRYENTERTVEPIGLWFMAGKWHLTAFCRLREDVRQFRIDRILMLEPSLEKVSRQHPPMATFCEEEAQLETTRVRIWVEKPTFRYLGDQKYYFGWQWEKEVDDGVEITFQTPTLEGLARWFLMMADTARILEPEELKDRVKEIIRKISERL